MAREYNIREYESFVDKSVLQQRGLEAGNGFVSLKHRVFEALESFVLENRDGKTDTLELMSLGAKRAYGKTITARNYVGTIVFKDGTTIQIFPKIASGGDADKEQKLFIKMLKSVFDLPMKEFDIAKLDTAKMGVMEPFIAMFNRAASELAKRGLRGSYEEREGNERFLKGKIDFPRSVKLNAAHAERLFVQYDEFGVNRPENRLIKTTLVMLRDKTRLVSTRRLLSSTLMLFVDVDASVDVDQDFARCQLDRTMGAYVPLLRWCRVFLKGESFTSFKGSEVASALLFPMETLFESYVAQEVRKAAFEKGWRATAQDRGTYLYTNPKRFRLRPDIVLRHASDMPVVFDTKWKRIGGSSNDGMSQSDMYQMYAYQHRYAASKAILVYPLHEGIEPGLRSEYASDTRGSMDALTQVFIFDLINASTSAAELVELAIKDSWHWEM